MVRTYPFPQDYYIRYGPESDNHCYIERIYWKDTFAGNCIKDRIEVPFDGIADFLSGKLQPRALVEQIKKKAPVQNPKELSDTIEGIQKRMTKNKLRPLWRVGFGRSTFQYEAESNVKIALDTSLQFVKEPTVPGT